MEQMPSLRGALRKPCSGPLAANVKGKPEIWDDTFIWAHVQGGGRDGLVRFRLWEEVTGVTFTQNQNCCHLRDGEGTVTTLARRPDNLAPETTCHS